MWDLCVNVNPEALCAFIIAPVHRALSYIVLVLGYGTGDNDIAVIVRLFEVSSYLSA